MDNELMIKAQQASNVEELLMLAKKNNIALTEEQAREYFAKLQPPVGELSDDELDSVAGGSNQCRDPQPLPFQTPDDELDIEVLSREPEAHPSAVVRL